MSIRSVGLTRHDGTLRRIGHISHREDRAWPSAGPSSGRQQAQLLAHHASRPLPRAVVAKRALLALRRKIKGLKVFEDGEEFERRRNEPERFLAFSLDPGSAVGEVKGSLHSGPRSLHTRTPRA